MWGQLELLAVLGRYLGSIKVRVDGERDEWTSSESARVWPCRTAILAEKTGHRLAAEDEVRYPALTRRFRSREDRSPP